MIPEKTYHLLIFLEMGCAILVFFLLLFISAPYGKFNRKGFGISISSKMGWFIMELPAVTIILFVAYFQSGKKTDVVPLVFILLWQIHYIYRTFIYSFSIRGPKNNFPVLIIFFAIAFNVLNGTVNGVFIGNGAMRYDISWFFSGRFILGTIIFFSGFLLHVHSDRVIRKLRKPGEKEYKIPYGGAFRFFSGPNYVGEIMQWYGWALLTWSPAGLAFALFTTGNLLPRAISNHKWYKKTFPEYPEKRKVLIPYLW